MARLKMTSIRHLKAPNAQGGIGFFTATVTRDFFDVIDIHVFEPSGNHVFSFTPQGLSGYLYKIMVPYLTSSETYIASCDRTRLATGIYYISLGNYNGAEHKHATLQIASNTDGILATQSVTMRDGQSYDSPTTGNIFNVRVSFNSKTNKYSASIE